MTQNGEWNLRTEGRSHDWRDGWRQSNRSEVYFSDEEIFALSHIDEHWHEDVRCPANRIAEDEMTCQRDMKVRGRRLWAYHVKLGDLHEFFPNLIAA